MKAFAEDGIVVRILPIGMIHFGTSPEWQEFGLSFLTPVTDDYVNVVCGEPDDFEKLLTAGVVNIAVTPDETPPGYDGCAFEPGELMTLLKEYGW